MNLDQRFSLSLKALVMDEHKRCLVLRRSACSKNNAGKWDFPGGKMDAGETFDETLRREIREETGLTVSLTGPFATTMSQMPGCCIVYLIMLAQAFPGEVQLSGEHDSFMWATPQNLPRMDLVPQFQDIARRYGKCVGTSPLESP